MLTIDSILRIIKWREQYPPLTEREMMEISETKTFLEELRERINKAKGHNMFSVTSDIEAEWLLDMLKEQEKWINHSPLCLEGKCPCGLDKLHEKLSRGPTPQTKEVDGGKG